MNALIDRTDRGCGDVHSRFEDSQSQCRLYFLKIAIIYSSGCLVIIHENYCHWIKIYHIIDIEIQRNDSLDHGHRKSSLTKTRNRQFDGHYAFGEFVWTAKAITSKCIYGPVHEAWVPIAYAKVSI